MGRQQSNMLPGDEGGGMAATFTLRGAELHRHPDQHTLPIGVFLEPAAIVQAELKCRLRNLLVAGFPNDIDGAPRRIAGHVENGLMVLSALTDEPELSIDTIEQCRLLAEHDRRFQFVHRLPASAGFGAAIGTSIERALRGEARCSTVTVAALLNVFMTVLDGLLDEAPDIIAPLRQKLLERVCVGTRVFQHRELPPAPGGHPLIDLCFAVADLWMRLARELAIESDSVQNWPAFASAVVKSIEDEYATCSVRLDRVPDAAEELWGRTRWPHWTQAMACTLGSTWPPWLERESFQRLIFILADYAAYLDDVCDYVVDCENARWNTVSYTLYRERPFCLLSRSDAQRRLLALLGDAATRRRIEAIGLSLRAQIDDLIASNGLPERELCPLVADLTSVYLG
jgi:hypothetical protein